MQSQPGGAGRRVRAAEAGDIPDLVDLELRAFAHDYGADVAAATIESVRTKITNRYHLLGDWFRVLEDVQEGVTGMLVGCPTKVDGRHLAELLAVDPEIAPTIYSEDGATVYAVNFAIDPSHRSSGGAVDLLIDYRKLGRGRGIRETYFRSQLPGLVRWAAQRHPGVAFSQLLPSEQDRLAEEYWRLSTRGPHGDEPVDPLLRFYVRAGSEPLQLLKISSSGGRLLSHGVFCRVRPKSG